ncbi:hypothetical protein BH23BAC1_BH23BAC1_38290 [soil metagenome]
MKRIKDYLLKHAVYFSIYFVIVLILFNSLIIYQFKRELESSVDTQKLIERARTLKDGIITNLNNIDMSLRGYMLVGNEAFLETYEKHKSFHQDQFQELHILLPNIGFNPALMTPIETKVVEYNKLMDHLVTQVKKGEFAEALATIKEDHGTDVWLVHVDFAKQLDPFIAQKIKESEESYQFLVFLTVAFNIILVILGIPILFFAAARLSRNARRRLKLFKELDQNNRELIFNSKEEADLDNEKNIIENIINNLNKTAYFINEMAGGKYEVTWEGLDEENKDLNQTTIAGELLNMRDEMKRKREDALQQKWVSEGLNKISEILRDHQNDFNLMTEKTLAFVVKFLEAQQGAFFVLMEDLESNEKNLELVSCFAFNRKKYETQRIEPGQGLIGQAYLEKEPILMTRLPPDYIRITSGLGEANPDCLIIYPFKHNEKVVAVLELASFKIFDSSAKKFLESASKTIAASLVAIRTNQITKELLEKSQQQAEEMRAQEEEMRQNMEELEATQEEMKRKELELKAALEQLQAENNTHQ